MDGFNNDFQDPLRVYFRDVVSFMNEHVVGLSPHTDRTDSSDEGFNQTHLFANQPLLAASFSSILFTKVCISSSCFLGELLAKVASLFFTTEER